MNRSRVSAIVRKDLLELRKNKLAMMPMVVVPLVLCVLLPGVLTALALMLDISAVNGSDFIERLLPVYDVPTEFTTTAVRVLYVFLNYMFVPFFMLVPIMVSSVIAANSVVGEKERRTLETLLYTPVSNRELIMAKQLSAFIPAVAISLLSFALYFVTVNTISVLISGMFLVRSLVWIPAILLVSPAASSVGLGVTLMVSVRSKTSMEAQQVAAVVIIPFLLILVAQLAGLFVMSVFHVIAFGGVLLVIGIVILRWIAPRFEREQILKTL
jgi:ABC-type Na+ efflux pump permease subunit